MPASHLGWRAKRSDLFVRPAPFSLGLTFVRPHPKPASLAFLLCRPASHLGWRAKRSDLFVRPAPTWLRIPIIVKMVGKAGFEPTTSSSRTKRASQLRYF